MNRARTVRLYRWTSPELPHGNFGDELSLPILRQLFSIEPLAVPRHEAELVCIGSILDGQPGRGLRRFVRERLRRGPRVLHVWGTGAITHARPFDWPQRLCVSAVRGRLTAARVGAFAGAIGDPGILASRLLERKPPVDAAVAFVPHHSDMDAADRFDLPRTWKLVRPDGDCLSVVRQIASAEMVLSSSLHGLIVADAFNIPAVWLRTEATLYGDPDYKFRDHATARLAKLNEPIRYAAALAAGHHALSALATVPGRRMDAWQDELTASFPAP